MRKRRFLTGLLRRLVERFPTLWWRFKKFEIRRQGWASAPTCDDAEEIYWTYSVGFEATLNHPEIVVANQAHGAIESLFALAYRGIRRGELVVRDGEPWDVLGLPRMVWRRVDRSRVTTDWFMMAMQHRYERRLDPHGLRVFQLVLADSDGHLPWEPAYPEEERRYTAELWRPA